VNAVSPLQEQLLTLEKVSELLKKIPVEQPENIALLEAATTKSLLMMLDQIGDPIAPTADNSMEQNSMPALPLSPRISRKIE